jgi:hypothetical protein
MRQTSCDGVKCSTEQNDGLYTFRSTFASILARRGIDSLHIMRFGRWESIQMVERYTGSDKVENSLRLYSSIVD